MRLHGVFRDGSIGGLVRLELLGEQFRQGWFAIGYVQFDVDRIFVIGGDFGDWALFDKIAPGVAG